MGIFSNMARKYLDQQRLRSVEKSIAFAEDVQTFAHLSTDGLRLLQELKKEQMVLRNRLYTGYM
jgi:hypothetical protein